MMLRFVAAAAAAACLIATAALAMAPPPAAGRYEPAAPFVTLPLPETGDDDTAVKPSYKSYVLTGAEARAYLAGVRALYGADLGQADALVIIEVDSGQGTGLVFVILFQDGQPVSSTHAPLAVHRRVQAWAAEHRAAASVR